MKRLDFTRGSLVYLTHEYETSIDGTLSPGLYELMGETIESKGEKIAMIYDWVKGNTYVDANLLISEDEYHRRLRCEKLNEILK